MPHRAIKYGSDLSYSTFERHKVKDFFRNSNLITKTRTTHSDVSVKEKEKNDCTAMENLETFLW